jgi:hypothetical protein
LDKQKKEVNLEINKKIFSSEEKKEQNRKYFYKAKILLFDFDLNCNSNDKNICNKIYNKKNILKNSIL